MSLLQVQNLARSYDGVEAVRGVSFAVEEGEIFGFLGPNGAGKSTTMLMLCTLLRPSGGRASVAGHDIERDPHGVRRSIGVVFQEPSLDDKLTGRENLRFHARLYDVDRAAFDQRAQELLELVDLADRADDRVEQYSGGMKRRLELVRGLIHRPRLLFLDEPTLGLDPQTRRHIWSYLDELRVRENVTIFMTTHYMDEAEHCDRIAIIDRGELVALDTPAELKSIVGGDVVTAWTSDNQGALSRLKHDGLVDGRLGPQGELILEVAEGERFIPTMMSSLSNGADAIRVESVSLRRPTLEDVFIKITGRAIRPVGPNGASGLPARLKPRRRR